MGEDFFMPWMSYVKDDNATDSKNKAIDAQTKAADNTLQLQRDQFEYQKTLNQPFYDTGLKGFNAYAQNAMSGIGPDGKFNPVTSDSFKWQQQQNQLNNSRTLRSLGRENSSYGMGEQFKSNQNLAANEYDKQLARLADLTNIARGGASAMANASAGFANSAGSTLTNQGNNIANAQLAGGLMNQNSMFNNQQNGMSLANLGMKLYDKFGNNSGSGGDSSSGWSTTSGQYGDSSYNGDGQLWD